MAANWTVIATFETYEKARDFLEKIPMDTNDNSIKEFKIKRYHDKFTVRSRYDGSLVGTIEDLYNTIQRLERNKASKKSKK